MKEYKKIIIIRYNEIALKKGNRYYFEKKLQDNVRKALKGQQIDFKIKNINGRFIVYTKEFEAIDILKYIPGISSLSVGYALKKEADFFKELKSIISLLLNEMSGIRPKSFKSEARRTDKSFPLNSHEINCKIGDILLDEFPDLKVDVHNPDFIVQTEIRDIIYISIAKTYGIGGLPSGSVGKTLLLLSGGIDSPVAGFLLASRGLNIQALHFTSYPYTSRESEEKVKRLALLMKSFDTDLKLFFCNISVIQKQLKSDADQKYLTILLRRAMFKISENFALKNGIFTLACGESVGQVASQTLESIFCTHQSIKIPVLSPCIGLNKEIIIAQAKKINTFNVSIEPHEDCCTIFNPPNPVIAPNLEITLQNESRIAGYDKLIDNAVDQIHEVIL